MSSGSLELKDVPGPSALGGGTRRAAELLYVIAVNDFKKTYLDTALGYLWSLARPLLTFGVLLAVFTHVFHFGHAVPHYPAFLLFNIVLFGFFSEATTVAVGSIVGHEAVVRKTQFPRLVIPISTALTGLFNLTLNLIIIIVFVFAFGVDPTWTWLLFPFCLLFLFILAAAVSMGLSVLYVRFRDVAIIWVVVAQVLFYGTPILYPIDLKGETFERLMMINPLAVIFEQARVWVLHEPNAPTALQAANGWLGLLPAAAIFVCVCVLGIWIFKREAPRVAENL